MKKIFLLLITTTILSSCGDGENVTALSTSVPTVVIPPASLLNCRMADIRRFNIDSLTDQDVSDIIGLYHLANKKCVINAQKLRAFFKSAKEAEKSLQTKK